MVDEYKRQRAYYLHSKNNFRKCKSKHNKSELINNSKSYKRTINKKFKDYQKDIVSKLKQLKSTDPKSYWSLLNKYSSEKKEIICKVTNDAFFDHFSLLNDIQDNEDIAVNINNTDDENISDINKELNRAFTLEEIDRSIKYLKNNKSSSSFDNILNEYLKNVPENMLQVICKLFNIIWDSGIFPDIWSKGIILPIYKSKGDFNNPDNYRGISILSCFGKLFTSVINNRLNDYLESYNIICEEQAGFRKHYSTTDHIFSLKIIIDIFLSKNKKLFCAFVDYSKAFDSVNRVALWQKLVSCNITGNCLRIIQNMYKKAKSCVKTVNDNKMSNFFESFTGVRQGENLSPVLFSLFLNDLNQFMSQKYNGLSSLSNIVSEMLSDDDVEVFLKLFVLLYADDTVIFAENATELQIALNAMFQYCNLWKLKVNSNKTKVVVFLEK